MKRRVVVTGLGLITPLGIGTEENWQSLCAGKSGIGPITRFDTTGFRTKIGGEVNDFHPHDFMDHKLAKRKCRFIHLAVAAAQLAMDDAGLIINSSNTERVGAIVGTAIGGVEIFEISHEQFLNGSRNQISPFFLAGLIGNMAPGVISLRFGIRGPSSCPMTACASGIHAIGDSFKLIQRGAADAMLAGGTDANLSPTIFAGLDALKVSSARNDAPEKASRPFDLNRDGFVTSEGSGIILLEEMESALNREASIYAEVLGYGLTSDAYHLTSPNPSGEGGAHCIRVALDDAGLSPEGIDHINAHGTSTKVGDLSETNAIKTAFKERALSIPVSATKSMLGHLWGAAGAAQSIVSILTIARGIIPPTINYETPDPMCDLDYVPNTARKARVQNVLTQAFGFGGTNGTLIFGRFSP